MDTIKICDTFSNGLRDGNFGKPKVVQENFNLQDAYDYGYDLGSNHSQEKKENGINGAA